MATNAHTEHPGGGKPQFPPFNKETFASQLVWFVIFFIALYVLIGRFAIPRIGGIIEARRGRVEGDLAEAEKTIAATKAAAMANVRGIAVETASAIVQRLIGTAPSSSAVEAAVADALKR